MNIFINKVSSTEPYAVWYISSFFLLFFILQLCKHKNDIFVYIFRDLIKNL